MPVFMDDVPGVFDPIKQPLCLNRPKRRLGGFFLLVLAGILLFLGWVIASKNHLTRPLVNRVAGFFSNEPDRSTTAPTKKEHDQTAAGVTEPMPAPPMVKHDNTTPGKTLYTATSLQIEASGVNDNADTFNRDGGLFTKFNEGTSLYYHAVFNDYQGSKNIQVEIFSEMDRGESASVAQKTFSIEPEHSSIGIKIGDQLDPGRYRLSVRGPAGEQIDTCNFLVLPRQNITQAPSTSENKQVKSKPSSEVTPVPQTYPDPKPEETQKSTVPQPFRVVRGVLSPDHGGDIRSIAEVSTYYPGQKVYYLAEYNGAQTGEEVLLDITSGHQLVSRINYKTGTDSHSTMRFHLGNTFQPGSYRITVTTRSGISDQRQFVVIPSYSGVLLPPPGSQMGVSRW